MLIGRCSRRGLFDDVGCSNSGSAGNVSSCAAGGAAGSGSVWRLGFGLRVVLLLGRELCLSNGVDG